LSGRGDLLLDLLLDDGACVLGNAEMTTAAELGDDSGLTAARASGDDVEGWKMDRHREIFGSRFAAG
jgi:hypothetical protein